MEARTLGQPAANQLGFVGTVVVQDEMYVEFRGHVAVDGVEEAAELAGAMTTMELAQHLAAGHVESGEQAGGAVAFVIVAAAFDLSRAHGQQRRRAIQRLNLALLVHAQNQRSVGRVQVEADDVADLVDKQRIAAQFESLAAMRLQRKSAPDAADAALAQSGGLGQRARGPVGGSFRLVSRVRASTRSTSASLKRRGVPGRGSSSSPSRRRRTKRFRHLPTVAPVTCTWRATSVLLRPAAQSSTMRARKASACAVFGRRVHSNNRCRSAGTESAARADDREPCSSSCLYQMQEELLLIE